MAMFFAQRVILGKTKFDEVPKALKTKVAEILLDSGLPELVPSEFGGTADVEDFNPRSRALCTCAHECRRRACIAEADNSGEGMERKPSRYLLLAVDDNIFAIER